MKNQPLKPWIKGNESITPNNFFSNALPNLEFGACISLDIAVELYKANTVDTGYLKRSIGFIINEKGVATFTEVFYGQFGDNSDLEENIKSMMPAGIPWQLIYTDEDGRAYQVVRKSSSGRATVETQATKATTRKSLGIGGIRNFLKGFLNGTKDSTTD